MTTLRTYPACAATALLLALLAAPALAQEEASDDGWIALFNGKDLTGWAPKVTGYELGENPGDTFRVEDGVLKVSYDAYDDFGGKFGHLFYEQPFSKYRLRVEYRFVGDQCPGGPGWAIRNNGVMFHGQDPKTMRVDQEFPVSIEAQLLGGAESGERPTGNLCTPGTNVVIDDTLVTQHCTNSKSPTYRGDDWVTFELEVNGSGTVRHIVNGEVVMEYEQPQLDPSDADAKALIEQRDGQLLIDGGTISIQAESHPTEFRKIEILPLP